MSKELGEDLENSMVVEESSYRERPEPDYDGPLELTPEEKLDRAQEKIDYLWELLVQKNMKILALEADLKKKDTLLRDLVRDLDKISEGLEGLK